MAVGYGQDTWCGAEYRAGRTARGLTNLALACYRRQITSRGELRGGEDEDNYGINLAEYIGALGGQTAAAALPGLIRSELTKDARVLDVEVVATVESQPNGRDLLRLVERITPNEADEDFELTLSVSEDGVELVAIRTL